MISSNPQTSQATTCPWGHMTSGEAKPKSCNTRWGNTKVMRSQATQIWRSNIEDNLGECHYCRAMPIELTPRLPDLKWHRFGDWVSVDKLGKGSQGRNPGESMSRSHNLSWPKSRDRVSTNSPPQAVPRVARSEGDPAFVFPLKQLCESQPQSVLARVKSGIRNINEDKIGRKKSHQAT